MKERATTAFPADHELLSFFEAEPALLDAKVPWFYKLRRHDATR
jgi:hypothetical protein